VLLDFGLALSHDMTRLSRTSDRPGTWITMSPEQLRGEPLDGRSDIYSLAVTMYWALTGTTPLTNKEIVQLAVGDSPGAIRSPGELNDKIDPSLSNIILKAMEREADDRFQSALELREALNSDSFVVKKATSKSTVHSLKKSNGQPPHKSRERHLPRPSRSSASSRNCNQDGKHPVVVSQPLKKRNYKVARNIVLGGLILLILVIFGLTGRDKLPSRVKKSDQNSDTARNRENKDRQKQQLQARALSILNNEESDLSDYADLGQVLVELSGKNEKLTDKDKACEYLGLYYSALCAVDNKLWLKGYSCLERIISSYGYSYAHGNDELKGYLHFVMEHRNAAHPTAFLHKMGYNHIISMYSLIKIICENGNLYDKSIKLHRDIIEKGSWSFENKARRVGLIVSLMSSPGTSSADNTSRSAFKTNLEESYDICLSFLENSKEAEDSLIFAPPYSNVLKEMNDEKYRIMWQSYFDKMMAAPDLSDTCKMCLYYGSTIVYGSLERLKHVATKDELLLLLDIAQKRYALGQKMESSNIMALRLEVAFRLSDVGRIREATEICENMLMNDPELKYDYDFLGRYVGILAKDLKHDKALSLLNDLIANKTAFDILSEQRKAEIKSRRDLFSAGDFLLGVSQFLKK
jgi:hypothetical protein